MQRNYRHTKDVLRHSVVYKKRRKAWKIKIAILFILLLCFFVMIVLITRMSFLAISEVQVKGLQSANTQDVIDIVNSDIDGNYALVIPKKNVMFYPKDHIKDSLLNKFNTFANVEIDTVDSNKLEVTITEKNAVAVGCQNEQSIVDSTFSNCFFIDGSAKGFQNVVGVPDQSFVKFVESNMGTTSSTLSSKIMEDVSKFKSNLEKRGFVIEYIKVVDQKNFEFKIVNNGKIIVSSPFDDNLISILNTALNTKQLSDGAMFEYVDARFGNKVFFRLKNGIISESKNSTTTVATSTVATSTANTLIKKSLKKGTSTPAKVKKAHIKKK